VFVLVGAGLLVAALRYSRADALFGAVAALALPLLMVAGVLASRRQVRYARVLASGIAHAGETIAVTLVPHAGRVHPPREILDITPAGPRFAVPAADDALRYTLALPWRGLWEVGPAIVRHADPFGIAFVDDVVAPVSEIAVAPRAATVVLPRLTSEDRETQTRTLTADRVIDPATVREYRHGDPRRLVHWRASLRRDRLMVRGERPKPHADVWLIVDTVMPPHPHATRSRDDAAASTSCAGAPVFTDASEDALAVATAVAEAAMRAGHRLHLAETGQGFLAQALARLGPPGDAEMVLEPSQTTGSLLRLMAALDLGTADAARWHTGIVAAAEQVGGGVAVIAILSHAGPARLEALAEVGRVADPCLAWTPDPEARSVLARAGFRPLTAQLPEAVVAA
jgi:uncharacterized protein (DUF58 family)